MEHFSILFLVLPFTELSCVISVVFVMHYYANACFMLLVVYRTVDKK